MKTPRILQVPLIRQDSKLDRFLAGQFSGTIFSYRQIFGMLGPLVLDQFFIFLIGMLTTSMISTSGQDSVSAVSLVGPVTMMVMSLFSALSAGGTVVVAQYKGRGDIRKMREAAGQVVLATFWVALVSSVALILFAHPLVNFLFASADPSVQKKAGNYLIGIAVSFITFSLYQGTFSVLRGTGDTKTCLRLTVIINLIHLFASMLFLNVMKLDIIGTALSFNIARLIGGGVAVYLLFSPKGSLALRAKEIFRVDFSLQKSIFRLGIPFAVEQVFFNAGSLIVQTYMVPLGTASIAANAISNSLFGLFYGAGTAVGTLAITVVGQCIGARDYEQARRYGKKMVLLGNAATVLSIAILYPLLPSLLGLYHPEPDTLRLIYRLFLIAVIPMPFFWTLSNVTPSTLRAAGDASFTSTVSLITMWLVRVGLGYLLAVPVGLGVEGVWISMGAEWAVRSVIFSIRFHGKTWLTKKSIE